MIRTLHSWVIILFFSLGFCLNGFAQQGWELLNPTPTNRTGLNIQFVSNSRGYIITENEILETLDSGGTWVKKQNINSGKDLKFNGTTGFIVGNGGSVLKSTDSGNTWNAVNTGYFENFNSVTIIDANTIIISSLYGLVKTQDGGITWNRLEITKGTVIKTFFTSSLVGHAACMDGIMLKTIDGGVTWYTTMTSNTIPSDFFTVFFVNDKIGFATREHNNKYKTVDGGETWTLLTEWTDAFYTVYFVNENVGYGAGDNGAIFKTTDGGLTWKWVSFQNGRYYATDLFGIFFTDENTGYVTGMKGMIYKTTDGGMTWTPNSPTYNDIRQLDFLTKDVGFALVGNTFYKTIDAGKKWNLVGTVNSGNNGVSSFDFIDENIGYAATGGTYGGQFFKTTDGGVSWAMVLNYDIVDAGINTMTVINEQTIYISGGFNSPRMMKSVDGGKTWEERSKHSFIDMKFLNENVAYAHNTYDKKVYKTTDGGYNWSVVFTGEEYVQSIDFVDDNNGYIVGSNALIYKTENGGLNWQKLTLPYEYYEKVKFFNKNIGYVFDEEGQLFKTENGGKTWERDIYFWGGSSNPKNIYFVDKNVYIAGGNGTIMKNKVEARPYYLELYPAKDVHNRFANLPGSIISNDGEITNMWIEVFKDYSFVKAVEIEPKKVSSGSSLDFMIPVWDLDPDTVYQYRLVAVQNGSGIFSDILNFKTEKNYVMSINPISSVYPTKVLVSGSVQSFEEDISDIEFEYSVKGDFSDSKNLKIDALVKGGATENISGTLPDLKIKTQYYVRMKAVQNGIKIYSEALVFTTPSEYEILIYNPTSNDGNIIVNAYIIANNKDITNIAFEYGEMNLNKSVSALSEVVLSGTTGFVNGNLGLLDRTKVYFYRLKALHDGKTIYSEMQIINFTNSVVLQPQTISKDDNNIFEFKGIVNSGGRYLVNVELEYGTTESFGISILANPNYLSSFSTVPVSAVLGNLPANQTYYYRLKAKLNGTTTVFYSDTYSFNTSNLGVNDFNYENNIVLYPNPTKGIVKIEAIENKRVTAVNVIDQTGNVIFRRYDGNSENLKEVDLSGKPTGVYFIQLILDDHLEVNKKVILK
ncbi:YCF48-related protein [Flavobacterium sp. HJSW_4]|uniref:T9SS type A sorting domain-containing protein n=1 Tax=Flavobacterium sp. HJSW_4 TaxID=3344660 RepID=UPI0035F281FC